MKKNIAYIDLDDTIANTFPIIIKLAKKYDIEILGGAGIINKNISSEDYYYFARMLGWNNIDIVLFFKKYYPSYLKKYPLIKKQRKC